MIIRFLRRLGKKKISETEEGRWWGWLPDHRTDPIDFS